ncbi:MAG: arsenite methyltransferase [Myxococcales bacterium]|nr:MAG: arsenite methyltransferase [Myxococcales bacterium]
MEKDRVHDVVKSGYAQVARQGSGCCGPATEQTSSCCGSAEASPHAETAARIGYAEQDITGAAADANLGLGCGNPTALASLKPGETVVDLGSGAGFDALLSAEKLGPEGRFIGVDMTPEMLERARTNAVNAGYARTVEFREGLIENLPVASESVDVVISNCVINLSPDKPQVFREAHRVLKRGGRLAVSDIVLSEPLPPDVANLAASWIACVGGASTEEEYLGYMRDAGFENIEYTRKPAAPILTPSLQDPMWQAAVELIGEQRISELAGTVFSYSITAEKR